MTTAIVPAEEAAAPAGPPSYFEKLLNGDLSVLTPEERTAYYLERCARLGLDPMSQPFLFMQTKAREGEQAKTILYATRSATDQIAKRDGLSGAILGRELIGNTAVVVVRIADGARSVENIGAASYKYDYQAGDALKRAATQAYRRGIIQFAGLGMVSEEDIADVEGARRLGMLDVDPSPQRQRRPAQQQQAAIQQQQAPRQIPQSTAAPASAKPAAQAATLETATGSATIAQRDRYAKLCAALDRPFDAELVAGLSQHDAAAHIAAMVKEFNGRARQPRTPQPPQPGSPPDDGIDDQPF